MTSPRLRQALLLIATLAVIAGAWIPALNQSAQADLEIGLKRALVTFAGARALGAALSVAQGTQVSAGAGVGVTVAPGQVLQPLNELVDKFADVMLLASVAFGIQILLLKIGAHAAVSMLLTAAMLAWLAMAWRPGNKRAMRYFQPVLVALLLARFAIPLGSLANEAAFNIFMSGDYAQATDVVQQSKSLVPAELPELGDARGGLLERMRRLGEVISKQLENFDPSALAKAAAQWPDRIVSLITIFVMQTVVLPIGLLWLLWRTSRALVAAPSQTG